MNEQVSFFDCNASFGMSMSNQFGVYRPCLDVEGLLAEMDWAGIDQALVYHTLMRDQSPVVGHAALAESIVGQPRLVGTWAILPPQTDELPSTPDFFVAMSEANVRALWAFPREHRYLLDRMAFGSLLDEVSERRIPLFIPRDAAGTMPHDTWALVYRLLSQYPQLTLVLAAHGPWGEDRFFRPLLERFPHFYLDISRYELDAGLRDLVANYGADHLLFGSNFPANPMGGAAPHGGSGRDRR